MSKPLCIYHGKCADGFTAAWAVYVALGNEVEFFPGVYQEPPPDVTGRGVIMVDFSYKRAVVEKMRETAAWIKIIDHHKTAIDDLRGIEEQPHLCPIELIFDLNRSGAGLTWDVYHPGVERPNLVNYVEDRDLWRFKLPNSRAINAFIFSHDYDFYTWDQLGQDLNFADTLSRAEVAGEAIERKHHKDVAELVGVMRRRMVIGGHDVPVANIPYTLTSDAGNLMAKGEPFAACYWDTAEGRVFSLRSTDDGMDVSAIAKAYGGGGHIRASGFKMPLGWEGDQ